MPLSPWRSSVQFSLCLLILLPTCCLFSTANAPTSTATVSLPAASAQPPPSPTTSPSGDWWRDVQEDLARREYRITWQGAPLAPGLPPGYQAPNRTHHVRVGFGIDGVHVAPRTPDRPDYYLGLGVSLPGQGQTGASTLSIAENQATYRRHELTERYTNDPHGLLQEIVVPAPAEPPFPITVSLAGSLTPRLDGEIVQLATGNGPTVLHYGPFQVIDAIGQPHAVQVEIVPGDTDATYALQITVAGPVPAPFTLRARLAAPPPPADWISESDQAYAGLGYTLSTAGDVDGDGYADLVVGAPGYDSGLTDAGAVFVYPGSAVGLAATPAWIVVGDQEDGHLGQTLSTAGDVNGDGYADVIAGAPDYDDVQADAGAAFVYLGSASGLGGGPVWPIAGPDEAQQEAAQFGAAVTALGDVNGDGFSDLAIGAPGAGDGGAVAIYHGGASGLTELVSIQGTQPGAQFGAALGRALGHAVGFREKANGYTDLLVGAPHYDGITGTLTMTDTGRVYVYPADTTGLFTNTVHSTITGDQAGAYLGTSITAGDVNGDGLADLVVGAPGYDVENGVAGSTVLTNAGRVLVYPVWPAEVTISTGAITGTASWTSNGEQAGARFGAAVANLGDTNGDGYADVIVGAPGYDDVQPDEGAVYVYRGGPSGLPASPVWVTHPTDQENARFGAGVAAAGDVNGDGYADVAVGSPGYDREQIDEGGAFVYHGHPEGLADAAAWQVTGDREKMLLGWTVANAGDVNGDGFSDLLVGAPHHDGGITEQGIVYLYAGGAGGPATTPIWTVEGGQEWARLGQAVAGAGDVNGDGYADVILGVPLYDHEMHDDGQARVYYGGPDGPGTEPDWTAPLPSQGTAVFGVSARFGYAVAGAGDVNGDGYADVLVTSNGYDAEASNEGAAFVYHGGPEGLSDEAAWISHPTDQGFANFGRAAGNAGDVNGDGFSDVIVGAPWYDVAPNLHSDVQDEGALYAFYGSAEGLSPTPTWTIIGDDPRAELGLSVATAGDVNGDGFSDVIAGAYKHTGEVWREGAAFVYHGGPAGLAGSPTWSVHPTNQENSKFAIVIASAGDVNGDGFSDVAIGSPSYTSNPAENENENEIKSGGVFVYYGGPTGIVTGTRWVKTHAQDKAAFGFHVAAGDWDGDGFSGLAVGAPTFNDDGLDQGAVFVYPGNGGSGLPVRPRQMHTDFKTPIGQLGQSDSATGVNLQLTARRIPASAPSALQWQVAPLGVPFTATGAISGTGQFTTSAILSRAVQGLAPGTIYRWRLRWRYRPDNPLGLVVSPWFSPPWNAPTEADFRTPSTSRD